MPARLKQIPPFLYIAVLLWVNVYIARDLFFSEFNVHTNSIQGLWIAMARLTDEHWWWPAWWPYMDGGMPFEYVYMPLAPALTALYSKLSGSTVQHAFHAITGLVLVFGPVTLFVLGWRLTEAPGYSFAAALLYSLSSTSRFLLGETRFQQAAFFSSRRLYTSVVWDDAPLQLSLVFLPLAVLFLWRSLEQQRRRDRVLAGAFIVCTVLSSVFGATALAICAVCLLAVFPRESFWRHTRTVAGIAAVSYLIVSPYLSPSLLRIIRANQQHFDEDKWTLESVTALCWMLFGATVVWWILKWCKAERPARFFTLLAYAAASIPLIDHYFNRHYLPQPPRYQPLMEFGLALMLVVAIRAVAARIPLPVRATLALALLCVAAEQTVSLRKFEKVATFPVAASSLIEYKVAKWMDQNMGGRRVMVPGSISQWMSVWTDTPQLAGGSYSTTPNWSQQDAMSGICGGTSPAGTENSLLWLKALGIHAVAVSSPESKEFWHSFAAPKKFDGILTQLWSEDGVTIYQVPQRSASLARVVPEASLTQRSGRGVFVMDSLRSYVTALDDAAMPEASWRWWNNRRASVRTKLAAGQVISVQTNYHAGWQARVNGANLPVERDGLGFMVLRPHCESGCEVELSYDGGWEFKLLRLLSYSTLITVAVWMARRLVQSISKDLRHD